NLFIKQNCGIPKSQHGTNMAAGLQFNKYVFYNHRIRIVNQVFSKQLEMLKAYSNMLSWIKKKIIKCIVEEYKISLYVYKHVGGMLYLMQFLSCFQICIRNFSITN
ncbi:hypothetical protein L9F63_018590, partial [Diploptera punctata]